MKFYKRLPLNRKNPMSNAFAVEPDGRIVTNLTNSIEMPSGTTEQRPSAPVNGQIRYNTSIGTDGGDLEAYVDSSWKSIKVNRQNSCTQQIFYNGDYANTIFGPLAYNVDVNRPQNVLVYVENVPQIANINYTLIQGSPTTSTVLTRTALVGNSVLHVESIVNFSIGISIVSGSSLNNGTTITSVDTTNSTVTISSGVIQQINSGSTITANYSAGTYILFSDDSLPVPSKPVIAILGFDGYNPPFAP